MRDIAGCVDWPRCDVEGTVMSGCILLLMVDRTIGEMINTSNNTDQ